MPEKVWGEFKGVQGIGQPYWEEIGVETPNIRVKSSVPEFAVVYF